MRWSLGGVAAVAVDDLLTCLVGVVARAGVAVVLVLGVEDVVDGHSEAEFLEAQEIPESPAEAQVAEEIVLERQLLDTGVGHVLLADVVALEGGVEAAPAEIEGVVEGEAGGEGDGGVAAVYPDGVGAVVVVDILREVLDAVAGEGGVDLPVEPVHGPEGGLELDAHAV